MIFYGVGISNSSILVLFLSRWKFSCQINF